MWRRHPEENEFTDAEEAVYRSSNILMNSLSFLGSSFIVLSLLCLARRSKGSRGDLGLLEHLHYKLVFMTSFADMIHSLSQGVFQDPVDKSAACYLQAVLSQASLNTSIGFVVCIAITLWGSFVHNWPLGDKTFDKKLFRRYCLGVGGLGLVTTLVPFWGDHYGESGSWCWIDNSEVGDFMRFTTLYAPLWGAIGAICVMYHQLIQTLDQLISPELESPVEQSCCAKFCSSVSLIINGDPCRRDDVSYTLLYYYYGVKLLVYWPLNSNRWQVHFIAMLKVIRRVAMYPVVLVLCWVMATINRIQNLLSDTQVRYIDHKPAHWL